MMPKEIRDLSVRIEPLTIECRDDGTPSKLSGYGAVFYREGDTATEFRLADDVVERIHPSAFDEALKRRDDVAGLVNHDSNRLLGRTTAGTMRLSVDGRGLRYEIDLDDTTIARDTAKQVQRGDLDGSSFAFFVESEEWRQEDKRHIREVKQVRLVDTGPVVFPAYAGTSADVRAEMRAADEGWRETMPQPPQDLPSEPQSEPEVDDLARRVERLETKLDLLTREVRLLD
jgi:HK97 family phage prohead protease